MLVVSMSGAFDDTRPSKENSLKHRRVETVAESRRKGERSANCAQARALASVRALRFKAQSHQLSAEVLALSPTPARGRRPLRLNRGSPVPSRSDLGRNSFRTTRSAAATSE